MLHVDNALGGLILYYAEYTVLRSSQTLQDCLNWLVLCVLMTVNEQIDPDVCKEDNT